MTLEEKQELIKSAKTEEELEARMAEIKADEEVPVEETTEKPAEEVEETTEEVKEDGAITPEEERSLLKDTQNLEKRSVTKLTQIESRGEVKMEEKMEFRNTPKYIDAYAEYIKGNKSKKELRKILTDNTNEEGTHIPVPTFIDEVIKVAWERETLMPLVSKIEAKGNFSINFEVSATDAQVHVEGSGDVPEEDVVFGIVTIKPESIKKWISISDEALDMRGEAFLRYIYDEITYRIAKKTANILIGKIAALPQTLVANEEGVYDKVSADKIEEAPSVSTVSTASAHLSDDASDLTIVMNRLTHANFVAAAKAANYALDPFDGIRVRYNNSLPAYDTATAGQVYMIVGDFYNGAKANYPNGEDIEMKYDDKTLMTKDLVKILGRRYVGVEPVADKAFTLVAKPTNA